MDDVFQKRRMTGVWEFFSPFVCLREFRNNVLLKIIRETPKEMRNLFRLESTNPNLSTNEKRGLDAYVTHFRTLTESEDFIETIMENI